LLGDRVHAELDPLAVALRAADSRLVHRQHHYATGGQRGGDALDRTTQIIGLGQLRDRMKADEREPIRAPELELAHVGADDLRALEQRGLGLELGPQSREQLRRIVHATKDAPGPAHQLDVRRDRSRCSWPRTSAHRLPARVCFILL
jgi:hypothetical protein